MLGKRQTYICIIDEKKTRHMKIKMDITISINTTYCPGLMNYRSTTQPKDHPKFEADHLDMDFVLDELNAVAGLEILSAVNDRDPY